MSPYRLWTRYEPVHAQTQRPRDPENGFAVQPNQALRPGGVGPLVVVVVGRVYASLPLVTHFLSEGDTQAPTPPADARRLLCRGVCSRRNSR